MTTLSLGTATADITPGWPLPLAGFAARTDPAQGVSHPLQVKVSVLESHADSEAATRAVVVVADLLWWGQQDVEMLRAEIAAIAGTTSGEVLLSATHTHSGPQTAVRASQEIGTVDPRFTTLLRDQVLLATRQATSRIEPVTLLRYDGTCDIGFNRRHDRNPHGPTDPALIVLRFERPDQSTAALWVHYTCHPVITQEPLVSSEYCGVAMTLLEDHHGAPASFLQGCCGDINPVSPGETTSLRGTNPEVVNTGQRLANTVNHLLATGTATSLAAGTIRSRSLTIDLPFATSPSPETLRQKVDTPGLQGELAQALLAHPEWNSPTIPLTFQRLDLADGCSLLAMNGEIVADYGLRIRTLSQGDVLPLGYANGMTGYVPTERILAEGGYEAGEAAPYFLLPAPFAPAVEPLMNDAIATVLGA